MADLRIDDDLLKKRLDPDEYNAYVREVTGGVDNGTGVGGAPNDFWGNNPTATVWTAGEYGHNPNTAANSGIKNSHDNSMSMAGSSIGTPDPMSMGGSLFTHPGLQTGDGVNPSPTVVVGAPVALPGAPTVTPGALQTPGGSDGHPQGQGQNPTSDNNQPRFGAGALFASTGGGLTVTTSLVTLGSTPQPLPTLPSGNEGTSGAGTPKEPPTTGEGTLSTGDGTGENGNGTIGTGDNGNIGGDNGDTGLTGSGDGTNPTGDDGNVNPNDPTDPNNEDPTGGDDSSNDSTAALNQQEQQRLEQLRLQQEQERLALLRAENAQG